MEEDDITLNALFFGVLVISMIILFYFSLFISPLMTLFVIFLCIIILYIMKEDIKNLIEYYNKIGIDYKKEKKNI